jgi:hypothetical protein
MSLAAHPSGRQPFAVPFREQRIEVEMEIASGQAQGASSFPCSQQNRVDKIVGDLARPRLTGHERTRITAKPRRAYIQIVPQGHLGAPRQRLFAGRGRLRPDR